MAMVRPYPPQPQPRLRSTPAPYNNLQSAPSNASLLRNPAFEGRNLAQHPAPQRYAHPLSRHNSYGSQTSDSGRGSKPPEHMLRRKTPNGILAAAYDGTSVEKNGEPHATKHILLPVTAESNMPYGLKQDLPLRSPGLNSGMGYTNQNAQSDWSPSLYFETGSGRTAQHLPQIDSMLNQIPPLQPLLPYQMYGQTFSGPMGPPLQSPLGPTVSNDQGPFGPYWHDGTYIPYRPAAMRDPRFLHHHSHNWNHPQHNPFLGYTPYHNNSVPSGSNYQPNHLLNQGPNTFNHVGGPPVDFSPYPQLQSNFALDYQNQSLPAPPTQRQDFLHSGQSTPLPEHNSTSPLAEYGPQSINGQSREHVFAWAHTVYVDLLRYLQSTRKSHSHNAHGRTSSRPHIYPKPPRQSGANFPSSSSSKPPSLERRVSFPSINPYASQPGLDATPRRPPMFHSRSSSSWSMGGAETRQPWQHIAPQHPMVPQVSGMEPARTLRRMSGSIANANQGLRHDVPPSMTAALALEAITKHCDESKWNWIDGILLGGCLAYALGDYQKAQGWYKHILTLDRDHVEAISNLAATLLALQQKRDAESFWRQAVRLRPSYFEAVEHLIGLLCSDHRGREAVQVIEEVERHLRFVKKADALKTLEVDSVRSTSTVSESPNLSETSDRPMFEFEGENESIFKDLDELPGSDQPGFGSSGYAIPGCDNGRILALVHAKGNMLYALGNNAGAAKAFENAVLIGAGPQANGIHGLIKRILAVVGYDGSERSPGGHRVAPSSDPILLPPDSATKTAQLCFPSHGQLPGLRHVPSEGMARKAAISTTSNSLLSLAKIFQDGMANNSPKATVYQSSYGVREILALYYLSLSLQPSPSTANNVGILLASVQQSAPSKPIPASNLVHHPQIPGLVPGSGVALALAYYYYGLQLDKRHAHLYTNLGSLLKDIGQLDVAIQMYEQAVACDQSFDIALANLANAVKDKGRISDAIIYYKRAVKASPDFAEAVCGLANALNSVCGWNGRGGIAEDRGTRDRWHVDENGMLLDARIPGASSSGWIYKVVKLVEKQLADGEDWGRGTMDDHFIQDIIRPLVLLDGNAQDIKEKQNSLASVLVQWKGQKWEGARLVRLVERAIRRLTWQWYQDRYVTGKQRPSGSYRRPQLPAALTAPAAPTVLPFHTFTCPMSAKQIRLISQRNGLRISCSTLRVPWLPSTVYHPPAPPKPYLKVGYVSSDFNNHPLAHLMQSVFGLHNPKRVKAFCYATTASDGSEHRKQIEREAPVFYDTSNWSAERLVNQIINDGIHVLINLNGYTRGARNEVFAARAAPIQMAFMGFAGTLGAEWCDYLLADETAVPPDTLRQWRRNIDMEDALVDDNSGGSDDNWVYGENIVFCRDTFFCCDHRQSSADSQGRQPSWEEEQKRRWEMRKEIFPNLPDDAIILGNFNQLYKIEPTTFRTWLRILQRLPKAILWLLRFPDLGETNLKQTAYMWAGKDVANRIMFTDVAQKHQHISRARVCDLFLDTPECNAHTTAADVLWSGTPLLTLPRYKYKMCSRMAASILKGALPKSPEGVQAAKELIAGNDDEYEEMAVRLASDCVYRGHQASGRLSELRKMLYESRWTSPLFDTKRWVRDLEEAYEIAWKKWERGEGGDIWLQPRQP
ncbi:glycosyltransferase family 41 protein [Cucurbitaria berberidis CBS 394.84]|uniref:protein O-GlcNAc transferase n=1 Tax=Cucurbitaria berberidis CBS 394.84 TaxID=1168544 RepID=A0A9P4GSY1_9PLEO|nr:glycosyltransferase family 41 protein [Cucurbitaria berberidis CBS 394.84]KAF1850481.1 glycosyltransferase family 41 protein [Cucurbitaria berberidis CBS 394.84]